METHLNHDSTLIPDIHQHASDITRPIHSIWYHRWVRQSAMSILTELDTLAQQVCSPNVCLEGESLSLSKSSRNRPFAQDVQV